MFYFFIVNFSPIFALLFLGAIFLWSNLAISLLVLAGISSVLPIFFLLKSKKNTKEIAIYSILPLFFTLSSGVLGFLAPRQYIAAIFFVAPTIFLYHYFRAIHRFVIKEDKEALEYLKNISFFGSFIAIFFCSAALYGFRSFMSWNEAWLTLCFAGFLFLSLFQFFYFSGFLSKEKYLDMLVLTLTTTEIFWVIFFLPLNFFSSGFIIAIYYYTIIGLARVNYAGNLNKKVIKNYLIFAALCLVAVLLSARWI